MGRRLRHLRCEEGVSHVQMLDALRNDGWDLDPATLSRIEQGTRTLTDIEILAYLKAIGKDWKNLAD